MYWRKRLKKICVVNSFLLVCIFLAKNGFGGKEGEGVRIEGTITLELHI